MAEIIWTGPALLDIDAIAEYIALDNPPAAKRLVEKVVKTVKRLSKFPLSGKHVREMPNSVYREIVVSPCRIFYRLDKDFVYILYVIRGKRLFHSFLLRERNTRRKKYNG